MSATAQDHSIILSQLDYLDAELADYLDAELAEMMDDPDAADEVVMVKNDIDELETVDDATVAAGTSVAHGEKGMNVLSRPYSYSVPFLSSKIRHT